MKFIGFYREMDKGNPRVYQDAIPKPNSPVSPASPYASLKVSEYLLAGHPILDVTEMTADVIGSAFRVPGGSSVLTDGSFTWRLDLASYVKHYAIPLPQDFLDFAKENGYRVPPVERNKLIEISLLVSRELGFRTDAGAAPRKRNDLS